MVPRAHHFEVLQAVFCRDAMSVASELSLLSAPCCIFGRTSEKAASLLVGWHRPSSEEFDQLCTAVRILAASIMWSQERPQVPQALGVEKTVDTP